MSAEIYIEVTQDDIDNGVRQSKAWCMYSRGLKRAGYQRPDVDWERGLVSYSDPYEWVRYTRRMPKTHRDNVQTWDKGDPNKPAKPVAFDITSWPLVSERAMNTSGSKLDKPKPTVNRKVDPNKPETKRDYRKLA